MQQKKTKNVPKWRPKGSQNAWSELRKSAWRPRWRPQAGLVVPKAPSQGLQLLILTSFSPHLDLSFSILQLFRHHRQCWLAKFISQFDKRALLSTTCISNIRAYCWLWCSSFTVHDQRSHFTRCSLSLFSKFPLTRVSNRRTYNQGMTKQLSPIEYPIKLSPR